MSTVKPSVLHIHFWADIRNTAGSVEKLISTYAVYGSKYTHKIACCPTDKTVTKPFQFLGIDVYPIQEDRVLNRVFNKTLGMKVFTYRDLIRVIEEQKPNILHIHNRQDTVDQLISRLSYRPGVVVHYHRHFEKPIIPACADRLIFISQTTASDILSKVNTTKPYSIVMNPLSQQVLDKLKFVDKIKYSNDVPVILFGGGGNPSKGGAELVSAFCRLPEGTAKLILAGRKANEIPIITPSPDINVIGEVSASDFFELMLKTDIVSMPSYDEPFGLIAQEAMLLRKLLLLSNSGGLTEFTDSDCAVLVEPQNVESLYQGLQHALNILKQPDLHASLLANADSRVKIFFPDIVEAQLEQVYDWART